MRRGGRLSCMSDYARGIWGGEMPPIAAPLLTRLLANCDTDQQKSSIFFELKKLSVKMKQKLEPKQ